MLRSRARNLLKEDFHVIEPFTEDTIDLDDYQKIDELIEIASRSEIEESFEK